MLSYFFEMLCITLQYIATTEKPSLMSMVLQRLTLYPTISQDQVKGYLVRHCTQIQETETCASHAISPKEIMHPLYTNFPTKKTSNQKYINLAIAFFFWWPDCVFLYKKDTSDHRKSYNQNDSCKRLHSATSASCAKRVCRKWPIETVTCANARTVPVYDGSMALAAGSL